MIEILVRLILLFILYSVIGCILETALCSVKAKKFVKRGFLAGIYCPIYGFAALLVMYILKPYHNNAPALFLMSVFVVSALEFTASYLFEALLHVKWRDYSDAPMNVHGRVALHISIFWGLCCAGAVYAIQPRITEFTDYLMSFYFIKWICPAIITIMFADLLYTAININSFRKIAEKWNNEFVCKHEDCAGLSDKHSDGLLESVGVAQRRYINAYPDFCFNKVKNFEEFKRRLSQIMKNK